ncbi:MAG TPA: serine hydrolase domain-containing protein [Wenzhouxiangella sp.]
MMSQRLFPPALAFLTLIWLGSPTLAHSSEQTQTPTAKLAASDWQSLRDKNILEWTPEEQRNGYPNIRQINPTREIPASDHPWPLPEDLWTNTQDWEAQMAELHLAGLLVIQGGKVRFEQYRLGHTADERWMSFSIAKSVVSLLYGIAMKERHIESLDETVATYLPRFEGTGYANVTIKDLLRMASGVQWNEDYEDPNSDVAALDDASENEVLEHLASLPSLHPPGSVFNYNTGETILAGAILSKAVGMSLSEYLQSRLWQPFGMGANADWALMGPEGAEMGGCCISATLRDYGRLGLFALNSGKTQSNESLLPQDWMLEATQPSPAADYYGYFWWLTGDGDYRASGIFGQGIHISPSHDLVVAMHGLWPEAIDQDFSRKRTELIGAIKRALNQSASD